MAGVSVGWASSCANSNLLLGVRSKILGGADRANPNRRVLLQDRLPSKTTLSMELVSVMFFCCRMTLVHRYPHAAGRLGSAENMIEER